MVMPLITGPGPDSSELAPLPRMLPMSRFDPATQELFVTPVQSPLPTPSGTWLERQLQNVQDAIATGRAEATSTEAETRALRGQIASVGILGGVDQALSDVHSAAKLQQLLPIIVLAIGVLMGKPAYGAIAAVVMWIASQDR